MQFVQLVGAWRSGALLNKVFEHFLFETRVIPPCRWPSCIPKILEMLLLIAHLEHEATWQ